MRFSSGRRAARPPRCARRLRPSSRPDFGDCCMAGVRIENVEKSFGSVKVIRNFDIEAEDGEFVVLVGPSGCGKSTLLRMIAGLEEVTSGRIKIGGRVVNNLNPKDRDIAMVFQNYALYPHMTARENMEFSLVLRRVRKTEREAHV